MAMSAEAKAAVASLFVFIAVVILLPLADIPDDVPLEFDLSSLSSEVRSCVFPLRLTRVRSCATSLSLSLTLSMVIDPGD
eukprot:3933085-Rhodomonas_salina.1